MKRGKRKRDKNKKTRNKQACLQSKHLQVWLTPSVLILKQTKQKNKLMKRIKPFRTLIAIVVGHFHY